MRKIVTFNLRTDVKRDGENRFAFRKGIILDKIAAEVPDVIGFQEVAQAMAQFLARYLEKEYTLVGCGRKADFSCESCKIAFRKDKFELMFLETFWLSDTPYVPGSRFECASEYPRVCTHVILRPLDGGTPFHVYNTHLDHISDEARTLGAKTIMNHMADDLEKWDYPVALMGDMNAYPDSGAISAFLNDPEVELINQTPDFRASYHGFGQVDDPQIDYIFTRGFKPAADPVAWGMTPYGKYLSDHNALCTYLDPLEK